MIDIFARWVGDFMLKLQGYFSAVTGIHIENNFVFMLALLLLLLVAGMVFLAVMGGSGKDSAQDSRATKPDEKTSALLAIEKEMLAVKELHGAGEISSEVYIAETRALFDKASSLK